MSDKIALFKEGRQLKEAKEFDAAIAKLKEAIALDPKFTMPLHLLTQIYTQLTRHEEAIATAKQIVEIEPDDQFSYIALSRAYQPAGMIPEAEYAMMQGQQALARAQAAKAKS